MATDSIEVAIRVRPLIRRENEAAQKKHWRVTDNTITQLVNGKPLPTSQFTFDHVFDESVVTKDIYETFAKPKIMSALLGFNATIFAYGQTSSGKTHTMIGDNHRPGIIPHVINDIFEYMNEDYTREYLLVITYMEIYNENITDLLNPNNKNLKIHENSKREVFVGNISQHYVSGSNQVFALMAEGEKNRHFGETNMNDRSSRSHTIFCIHIESRERAVSGDDTGESEDIGAVRVSQLNLVDLAGSERVSQTGAEGQRLKEGAHINKSLFTLGTVIAKLSEGESTHVPFRDSKLTRILQSSLGGNAKTAILCTITPVSIEESHSTLKFASRAKTIKNCPLVNEVLDDGAMLKRMKKEIRDLKKQLMEMQDNTCISELQTEKEKYQKQLEEQRTKYEKQIQKLAESFFTPARLNELESFTSYNNTSAKNKSSKRNPRRETWCPGAMLSKNPLASAAEVAQSVLTMEYEHTVTPLTIMEEPEDTPVDCKTPEEESKFEVEILKSEYITLKSKLESMTAERNQLIEELDDARNDSISVQKQAFTEAQEMIYNHKEKIEFENKELHEKIKETNTKNNELVKEVDTLKTQLLAHTDKNNEADLKIECLTQQITELKTYINEIRNENVQHKEELQKKVDCIEDLETRLTEIQKPKSIPSRDDEVENLKEDIKELQTRLKKKTASYDELLLENEKNNQQFDKEFELLKLQIATDTENRHKAEEELSALKTQFEDLFYKYDELRMTSNLRESELEKLKRENTQLKTCNPNGFNKKNTKRRSSKIIEHDISGESLDENDALTALNQTLQTKCEELEQITFLYDERELEIREVRDSLEEYQSSRKSMEDTMSKQKAQIEELLREADCLKDLLEAKSVLNEKDKQVLELRQIIKEQENEMIRLKSSQTPIGKSSKVEELEASSQQLDDDLYEARSTRDDIQKENVELRNLLKERDEEFEKEKNELENRLKERDDDFERERNELMKKNVELQNNLNEKEQESLMEAKVSLDDKKGDSLKLESFKEEAKVVRDENVNKQTEHLEELKAEIVSLENELLEAKNNQTEVKTQALELRQIIKEQEAEIIRLGENLKDAKSSCNENESQARLEQMESELFEIKITRDDLIRQRNDLQNVLKEKEEEFEKEKDETVFQNIELQKLLAQKEEEFRLERVVFLDEKEEYESKLEALNDEILKISGDQDTSEDSKKEAEQIETLQIEVEYLQKELLDAKSNHSENEKQVVELRYIIKEQETEIIKLGERLKCGQPFDKQNFHQGELEQMKNELNEIRISRDDYIKQKTELQNLLAEREAELEIEKGEILKQKNELQNLLTEKEEEFTREREEVLKEKVGFENKIQLLRNEDTKEENFKQIIQKQDAENTKLKSAQSNVHDDPKLAEMLCSLERLQIDLQNVTSDKEALSIKNDDLQNTIVKKEKDLKIEVQTLQDVKECLKVQLEASQQQIDELTNKMTQADARIVSLRRVIDDLEEDMFSTESKKEELEKELEILHHRLDNQDGLESLRGESQILVREKEEIQSQLETANQSKKELEDDLVKITNEMQILQGKNEELESELHSIHQKHDTELNEMRQEKRENGSIVCDLENKLQTLKNENEELKSELQSVQKYKDELNGMIHEKLESEVDRNLLKQQVQTLEDEREELKAQLESSRQQNEELTKKIELADTRIENLRRVINDQEEDMFSAESQKEKMEKELETLQQKLENECSSGEIQEKLKNAMEEINSYGKKEIEYQTKITQLARELDEAVKQNELTKQQAENHVMAKQAELEDIQDQMMKNVDENQKLRDSMNRLREQMKEMKEALMNKQGIASKDSLGDWQNEINELKKVNEDLQERLENSVKEKIVVPQNQVNADVSRESYLVEQTENEHLRKTLEQLQEFLRQRNVELEIQQNDCDAAKKQMIAYQEELSTAKQCHLTEIERLKKTIDELKDKIMDLVKKHQYTDTEQETKQKLNEALEEIKKLQNLLADSESECKHFEDELNKKSDALFETTKQLEIVEKKLKKLETRLAERQPAEIEEANNTILQLKAELNNSQDTTTKISVLQEQNRELQEILKMKTQALEEQTNKLKVADNKMNAMHENVKRLRNIIDEQQDEIDEALKNNQQLQGQTKDNKDATNLTILQEQIKELQESLNIKNQAIEEQSDKLKNAEKKMNAMYENVKRLRNIIDEQQDEIDESLKNNQELQVQTKDKEKKLLEISAEVERLTQIVKESAHGQLEDLRVEIAQKNMKIQELEYKYFKGEKEIERLRREVQFGYSKMSKLKEDMRKLREEAVKDDTITIERNVSTSSESDVGVVSSVAVYSLKAKLGELEKQNERLTHQNKQLEKDKVTLSLFKTDISNQASKLSDEVQFLKKQNKDLTKQNRVLKGKDDKPAQQSVLASSNPPEDCISVNAQEHSLADRCRSSMAKDRENRPAASNWLSPSKTKDMFKDKANQCPHQ